MRGIALLAVLLFLLAACGPGTVPLPRLAPSTLADRAADVARGEYIVRNAANCGGCHASTRRDPDGPLAGGEEFRDWRLGIARASNLTSDSATGLGTWSEAEIVRALRNGIRKDGRLLAPVMPYEWIHGMSDADALAVARYLGSLPPVRNEVRQQPNLVFRLARTLFLRPKKGDQVEGPVRGVTVEYGGYLANHVALCSHCHTPRTGLFNRYDNSRAFAGDASPPGGFPANPANITPDSATGIGRWSEAAFLQTIRTGVTPAGDSLHPVMPWRSIRRMTDDDLRAIYRYLRTLPPIRNDVPRRSG